MGTRPRSDGRKRAGEERGVRGPAHRQLRAQGASPESIYVGVRRDLAGALTRHLERAREQAEILSAQGVSQDTIDRHLLATTDSNDAVATGLRDKVFPQPVVERPGPQQTRIAKVRQQGVPEAMIATQMRAQAAQVPTAEARSVEPEAATEEPQQTRLARLASCVTGRGAAQ